MSKYNTIRPVTYLPYLILLLLSGCAEKPVSRAFVNELPPLIEPRSISQARNRQFEYSIEPSSTQKSMPVEYKTAWDRLTALYTLPVVENERVEQEIQRYLKHPEYLVKIQQRAEPYLYYILNQVEAKNIPGELALLPVVESAFRPNAISSSRASGLWQFMPATGRLFGLKQNWWYDGRNDIYTSTQAATSYLKQLGKTFDNDWLLAVAAYNAGKGNIRKAIRQNKNKHLETDYWSLSLRKETMQYVPRLLAIAKIFAHPERYNIDLHPIANEPFFTVVNVDSQLDIHLAAKMAGLPLDDFFTLNPGFKRASTDPDGPFHLLIHRDKAESFKEKLAHTAKEDRMRWIRHHIKAGENLGSIAKKYHTTVNALRHSNKLTSTAIRAGKDLLIPTSIKAQEKSAKTLYTVKKGDTFWEIARQFDVKSKDIADWNNLSLNTALQPGQKLIIKES